MDEIARIKEQIQMIHERLEIVEAYIQDRNTMDLRQLSHEVNNLKIAISSMRHDRK